jgi:hypothetical protein
LPEKWANVADAPHLWRKIPFLVLLSALLLFGFWPRFLIDKIQPSVKERVLTTASSQTSEATVVASASIHPPLTARPTPLTNP